MSLCIHVLGMHRSGTSASAGAMVAAGCEAPATLMVPAPENPEGFWESAPIVAHNDRLLAEVNRSWSDWRWFDLDPLVNEEQAQVAADLLVGEFGQARRFILKDPRITRLLPLWRMAAARAGFDQRYLVVVRRPDAVAKSLMARNTIPRQWAALLWLRYYCDVLVALDEPTALLDYDEFMAGPLESLTRIDAELGLGLDLENEAVVNRINQFVKPGLRHHRESSRPDGGDLVLPSDIADELYRDLVVASAQQLDPDRLGQLAMRAQDALAGWESGFGDALVYSLNPWVLPEPLANQFSVQVAQTADLAAQVKELAAQVKEGKHELEREKRRVERVRERRAESEAVVAELREQLRRIESSRSWRYTKPLRRN